MAEDFPQVDDATWRQRVEAELKGANFDRALRPESFEEFAPLPLYTRENSKTHDLETPGQFPFRRGRRDSGTCGLAWDITQRHSLADLDELESAILEDQSAGVRGVWLVFDRAARLGMDIDDSAAIEHGGIEGAPIHELSQLDQVIGGLDFGNTKLHLDCGANAKTIAAIFFAICELREIETKNLNVHFNADPIAALARDGEIPGELTSLIDEAAKLALDCQDSAPLAKTFTISTEPWQEAGVTTSQEIGIALATALCYLGRMESSGLSLESAADQISFRLPMGRDIFTSIAKVRALRSLWSSILASCGIKDVAACAVHAVPSRRSLTRFDPWVNMLRTTSQTLSAAVSGADEITSARFDEMQGPAWWPQSMDDFVHHASPLLNSYERANSSSSALGRRVARNTQVILAEEAHIGEVADPAGGSYYVEALTDEIAKRAWSQFQDIEIEGGIVAALRNDTLLDLAKSRLSARSGRIRRRKDPITGVSEYADIAAEDGGRDGAELGAALERARKELVEHKQARGSIPCQDLASLKEATAAALAGATVGEISRGLTGRGETECLEPLRRRRDADDFEELREFAAQLAAKGRRPNVYLATMGSQTEHGARSAFASNFFAAGGITCTLAETNELDHVKAFKECHAEAICICGNDGHYEQNAASLIKKIQDDLGAETPIFIAGRVDGLSCQLPELAMPIYIGCDLIHVLGGILYLSEASEKGNNS